MGYYNVILVDDETDVRTSIAKKLDWNSLGFMLAGSAANGEEALELIMQTHVDVVMTDIKMPFMDGLTLCRKVKEYYRNTRVILYSGFDEFEYAKEAVHLEADEYLLKPIGSEDLKQVFINIRDSLDREIDERKNFEKLRNFYVESLPVMREHLLAGMLSGKMNEAQTELLLDTYGLDFYADHYCVGILGTDDNKTDMGYMMLLSLLNIARDYLSEYIKCYICMYLDYIVAFYLINEGDTVDNFVYHMNQVCQMGSRILELRVNAGIGNAYSHIRQISLSYDEACTAYDYRIWGESETGQAYYIKDVEPETKDHPGQSLYGIADIIHEIKFGTESSIAEVTEAFTEELCENGHTSIQQYQISLMELMTELTRLIRSYGINTAEVFGEDFDPYKKIKGFSSIADIRQWTMQAGVNIQNEIGSKRTNSAKQLIEKAREYIEENYSRSDLSVELICNYLGISATYFSTLFKKETGLSFVAYLTEVRLEHARELLETTDYKSYMIAEKVGYTEANYFSYVFKKQYGVSPSRYRTDREKNEETGT